MRQQQNHNGKRLSAFTLIELIVVMAILVTVMGISVTLIFMMFDFQQRYAEQSTQIDSTNRFVEQFRNDSRSQGIVSVAPNAETLLQWGNVANKITYSLVPGEFPEKSDVVRRVWQGDQITATEIYHLPDYAALRFVVGEGHHTGLLAMSLWEQPPYTTVINPEELDPFTRTLTGPQSAEYNPNVDGNWRTAIVRVATPITESENRP